MTVRQLRTEQIEIINKLNTAQTSQQRESASQMLQQHSCCELYSNDHVRKEEAEKAVRHMFPENAFRYFTEAQTALANAMKAETDPDTKIKIANYLQYTTTNYAALSRMKVKGMDAKCYLKAGMDALNEELKIETNRKVRIALANCIDRIADDADIRCDMSHNTNIFIRDINMNYLIEAFKVETDPKAIVALDNRLRNSVGDHSDLSKYFEPEQSADYMKLYRDALLEKLRTPYDAETTKALTDHAIHIMSNEYPLGALYDRAPIQTNYIRKSLTALVLERANAVEQNKTDVAAVFNTVLEGALGSKAFIGCLDTKELQDAGYLQLKDKTGDALDKELKLLDFFVTSRLSELDHAACDTLLVGKLNELETAFAENKVTITASLEALSQNQQPLDDYKKVKALREKCTMAHVKR